MLKIKACFLSAYWPAVCGLLCIVLHVAPAEADAMYGRLAADGVPEFAVFLIDAADDGHTELCSDAWVQHARAFINGSAF